MKKLMLITAILLSIALSSKAQYSLMLKGERNPFDTAVAIHIDTYRLESKKFSLADTLIKSLKEQLVLSKEIEEQQGIRINNLLSIQAIMKEQLDEKNLTINRLTEMYKPKEETWWKRNQHTIYFIGGLLTGGGTVYLITK